MMRIDPSRLQLHATRMGLSLADLLECDSLEGTRRVDQLFLLIAQIIYSVYKVESGISGLSR
jgi:hypothetical protein